jgi:hypothetical protein
VLVKVEVSDGEFRSIQTEATTILALKAAVASEIQQTVSMLTALTFEGRALDEKTHALSLTEVGISHGSVLKLHQFSTQVTFLPNGIFARLYLNADDTLADLKQKVLSQKKHWAGKTLQVTFQNQALTAEQDTQTVTQLGIAADAQLSVGLATTEA